MGASGVPMIDEEGRPRPIKVQVTAETRVEGCRNVVGEKAVLDAVKGGAAAEATTAAEAGMGKKEDGAEEGEGGGSGGENAGVKRQREESEADEGEGAGEDDGKRVRTQ